MTAQLSSGPSLDGAIDLDEPARVRRALHEIEARYQGLIDGIPAIVYVTEYGEMGDWLYVSQQIESMLGYTAEEWMAHDRPFHTHVHPDDLASAIQAEVDARDTAESYSIEYRMFARDGRMLVVRDEASVVRGDDGDPLFWQGVMFDHTELRALGRQREELAAILTRDVLYSIAALRTLSVSLVARWHELNERGKEDVVGLIREEAARLRETADGALALMSGEFEPKRNPVGRVRDSDLAMESARAIDLSQERIRAARRSKGRP